MHVSEWVMGQKEDEDMRLPFVVNSLDNKAERGRHGVDILPHNPLHDRGLPGIIKSPFQNQPWLFQAVKSCRGAHSIKIRISLSFRRAFLSIDNISGGCFGLLFAVFTFSSFSL